LRSGIVVFQAHVRGYLARRRFMEAKLAREEEVRGKSLLDLTPFLTSWNLLTCET
jgi:hypothetical protein